MKNPRCSASRLGLSLVELLIASLVLAIAGSLLGGALLGANRSTDLRRNQSLAAQLLANALAQVDESAALGDQAQQPGGAWEPLTTTQHAEEVSAPVGTLVRVELAATTPAFTLSMTTYRRPHVTEAP